MAATKHNAKSHAETTVQSHAARLEAELQATRQLAGVIDAIRKLKKQFPSLFERFRTELHAVVDEDPSEIRESSPTSVYEVEKGDEESGLGLLIAYFRNRSNQPASIREIAQATGRSPVTIKSIIYMRHKGRFEIVDKRGRNNRAYFRLAGD